MPLCLIPRKSCRTFLFACGWTLAASNPSFGTPDHAQPPRHLSTAAHVRALAPEQARLGLPVRLRGVYLGEADPEGIAFVIQDASDGIYVQGPPESVVNLGRGDLLEVDGITDPGGFAPYVVAHTVTKVGSGEIPEPTRVTLDELNAGQMDAKWVEISGVVRSVEPKAPTDAAPPPPGTRYVVRATSPHSKPTKVKMKLAEGGARVVVEVCGDVEPAELVDAEVRLRGLCFNLHNRNRQFVRPFVQVPRGVNFVVERAAPEKPFDSEPRPVGELLRFDQLTGKPGHRVHVRGTVIHHQPGSALWIRDHGRSLRIDTPQQDRLQPGDEVDVLGFPSLGNYSAVLEDAVFRRRGRVSAPAPHRLSEISDALQKDGDLVELEGQVVDVRRLPEYVALTLKWHDSLVRAQLRWPDDGAVPARWRPGSLARVAGICSVVTDEAGPLGGLWEPRSFQLLLRSPADLAVLAPPPWWSPERIVWLLAGIAGFAVVAIAAVMLASRRRLKEQEHRRAMAETEFAAILNERNRVAREIHDTLSQNLGAISVQLELARAHGSDMGDSARQHLATAHKLARAALADARDSIWNMRSQVLERCDLGEAIEGILRQMTDDTRIKPTMTVAGDRRRLPPVVENNLLRIGQEAITNATHHAQPSHIEVTLTFEGRAVELIVSDDGIGFDPTLPPNGNRRSFGLVGMKERAELLGGSFELKSIAGRGTRIAVRVSV